MSVAKRASSMMGMLHYSPTQIKPIPALSAQFTVRVMAMEAKPAKSKREKKAETLTIEQSAVIKGKIYPLVPSITWLNDLHSKVINGEIAAKSKIDRELDRKSEFPPGGRRETLMRICKECGRRWCPPQYLTEQKTSATTCRRICADCIESMRAPFDASCKTRQGDNRSLRAVALARIEAGIYEPLEVEGDAYDDEVVEADPGPPAVAVAMMEMEARGVVLDRLKLPTESKAVLERQLERYRAGKPTSLISPFPER
jgi:hypothetical protein